MLGALRMVPVIEAATILFFTQFIDSDDVFRGDAELEAGAAAVLDETARLTRGLLTVRR